MLYQSVDGSLSEERIVYHFHFVHWPDFGVPDSPDEFLDFLSVVRQSGCFDVDLNRTESDPVVVHCTAGIGRTGTFVLVDVCLALVSSLNLFFESWKRSTTSWNVNSVCFSVDTLVSFV